jgi:hypothetical protein
MSALPGVSVHYCDSTTTLSSELNAFFTAIKAQFGSLLTWTLPASGDALDAASGHIVGTYSDTGWTIAATGSPVGPVGVGTYVSWGTADVGPHRRIKGKTFLTGLVDGAYNGTTGLINSTTVTVFQNAANTVIAAEKLKIWSRPPKGTFSGGAAHLAVAASVTPNISSLRTRRR